MKETCIWSFNNNHSMVETQCEETIRTRALVDATIIDADVDMDLIPRAIYCPWCGCIIEADEPETAEDYRCDDERF